ncbi:MAG TPA: MarR family transcriptional regulator [Streptosporangiaceae bacterium]|nr:MarR family transcriptional regulator [Streptosporangiaceae bacterium]
MSSLPGRDTLIRTLRSHSQRATTGSAYLQHLIGSRAGLNPTDVRAASILAQDGPMTAGGLQRRLHLTGGAATTAVDRLVRRGIATRSADPGDRRKVTVAINPDSLAAVQPVYDTIDRAFDEVLASYTDSELALLVRYFADTITLTDKLIAQLDVQKAGEPD